jgi:hypothetical protein
MIDPMTELVAVGQEAYGIVAIGQHATGVIAIGQIATGVVAIGQVARGGIAIGMVAIGLASFGMAAVGLFWVGGMAVAGARVQFALLGLSVAPVVREGSLRAPAWWAVAGLSFAAMVGLAVAFWVFAGVPVGDALWGPDGIMR